MPTTSRRYSRAECIPVARQIVNRLAPFCERLIIAGSLRRGASEVGDIEVMYISRTEKRPFDLFTTRDCLLADLELERMIAERLIAPRANKLGTTAWGSLNKLAIHCESGIPVDLFRTTPEKWFCSLVCRTGPAALNTRIATEARRRGYRWNPYGSGFTCLADGAVHPVHSEREIFDFLSIPYCSPLER